MSKYDHSLFEELDVEALDHHDFYDEDDRPIAFESDDEDYWDADGPSIWDDPNFEDDWMEYYVDDPEEDEEGS